MLGRRKEARHLERMAVGRKGGRPGAGAAHKGVAGLRPAAAAGGDGDLDAAAVSARPAGPLRGGAGQYPRIPPQPVHAAETRPPGTETQLLHPAANPPQVGLGPVFPAASELRPYPGRRAAQPGLGPLGPPRQHSLHRPSAWHLSRPDRRQSHRPLLPLGLPHHL